MDRVRHGLTNYQPATYQVQVVGHLDGKRVAWFESLDLTREYEDGTPVTMLTVEAVDQPTPHGPLVQIRDPGVPLLAVHRG